MTSRNLSEAGWELANDCLDILPADDLAATGLALIHLVAVWLAAVPEEARPLTYVQWLEMLHRQLDRAGVLAVATTLDALDESPFGEGSSGQAVH